MDMSEENKTTKDGLGDLPSVDDPTHDAVFGEITEEGPNYRNVHTSRTILAYTPAIPELRKLTFSRLDFSEP